MGPELAIRWLRRVGSVPHASPHRRLALAPGRAGRHRLGQHRLDRRSHPARAPGLARRRHPDRRAPHVARGASRTGSPVLRRAPEGQRVRDVPGACVCDDRAMSRLPALTREQLDESGQELWDQIVSTRPKGIVDSSGGLRGPFNPWLFAPEVGRRTADLGAHLRFGVSVERRLLELAIITTGARWKAEFEWWAHVPMAREHGVSEPVIEAIGRGETPHFERDDERIVYAVATQLGA